MSRHQHRRDAEGSRGPKARRPVCTRCSPTPTESVPRAGSRPEGLIGGVTHQAMRQRLPLARARDVSVRWQLPLACRGDRCALRSRIFPPKISGLSQLGATVNKAAISIRKWVFAQTFPSILSCLLDNYVGVRLMGCVHVRICFTALFR